MQYTVESIEIDPIFGPEITIKLPDNDIKVLETNINKNK